MFTIITAGWVQVEYRALQLMPWALMGRGPTPASESIFLDYISKWNAISLFQSFKQGHFLVSLCVAGSLLLNGVTVFSTGLFEQESVLTTQFIDLTAPQAFSGTDYDPSKNDAGPYATCSTLSSRNLSHPFGVHGAYVYTPFQPASVYATGNKTIPVGVEYQANVQIIEPLLDCQNATVQWGPDIGEMLSRDDLKGRNTTIWSTPDGCSFQIDPHLCPPTIFGRGMTWTSGTDFTTAFFLRGCGGEIPGSYNLNNHTWTTQPDNGTADWRVWAAVIKIPANETHARRSTEGAPPYHVSMCTPRYNVYRGPVRIWREAGQDAVAADIQTQHLNITKDIPDVPAANLLYSGFQSFLHGLPTNDNSRTVATNELWWELTDAQFTGHENITRRTDWDNMAELTDALQSELLCLGRQVVFQNLLRSDPHQIEGTRQLVSERLFVRPLSFWLMASLLACLIIVTILLLCFFVPVAVCPRDTASIGGMAIVFAESPEFMILFKGSQLQTETQMAEGRLGGTAYTTSTAEGAFKLLPQSELLPQSDPSDEPDEPTSQVANPSHGQIGKHSSIWWHPFSASWFARASVITLPISVIIGLEVVYHISTSSRGITLVDGKSSYIHYLWSYIPALIMFIIRCLFTSVEFGARIIQPYCRLREGSAPPETIFENHLRKIALFGVLDTLRKKQWALAAATVSLLLAAINPIVVSGLYTIEAEGRTFPMNLTQTSRWNLGDPTDSGSEARVDSRAWTYTNSTDYDSQITGGLIIHLNLSDPQWTYNNLAFPHLALSDNPPDAGYIDTRIPALRSQLSCAPAQFNTEPNPPDAYYYTSNQSCPNIGLLGASKDEVDFISSSGYFLDGSEAYENHGKLPNCSTHSILYGKWRDGKPVETHFLNCMATVEEVDVDTRLRIPSLSIDTDFQPRVVPNSNRTAFDSRIPPFLGIRDLQSYLFQKDPKLNNVLLDALVNGINGVPAEELLKPNILGERMNAIWGIIMAQLFNSNGRESFQDPLNTTWLVEPATSHAPLYEGVFHDGRKYLVQNKVSTRILDGVLAAMVVCAIIALCMMRTKGVLPKSPCSIASVASFVAESNFLGTLRGAEWCNDAELRERGVFDGLFSMGWWKVERELASNESIRGSDASSLSSFRNEAEAEAEGNNSMTGDATRFGIDLDGKRPLLEDVE